MLYDLHEGFQSLEKYMENQLLYSQLGFCAQASHGLDLLVEAHGCTLGR